MACTEAATESSLMVNLPSPLVDASRSGNEIVLVLRAQPGTRTPTRIHAAITEPIFDHDRLDVYRLAIDYVASSFGDANLLDGVHRHARD